MEKKTIVYLNPDCFSDTDLTVLRHLTKEFNVIWFYIYESKKTMRLGIEGAKQYADKYGIELHICVLKVRYRDVRNYFFYRNIVQTINRINPALVYHCSSDPYLAFATKISMKCKKVVMGIHDAEYHTYSFSISRQLSKMSRIISLKSHRYFATFSPNQQTLLKLKYGLDSEMIGMSYKYFGKSCLQPSSVEIGVKLLFFGSIQKYKGLDLLIEAMEKLRTEGIKKLSLTIAGCGEDWDEYKKLIDTPEMYDFKVRFIDNSEIPDLMSSHHFLVLPYRDSTQSGPLWTALAYDLPIIAPDFKCFHETYTNKSGILYKYGELEHALKQVSTINQREYDSLKIACTEIKSQFSEEAIAYNYINYFRALMRNS